VRAVSDHDVLMLKADVTDEDAPGRELLRQLSPAGAIPLTAVYPPRAHEPIILTGIYSQSDIRQTLQRAAGLVARGPIAGGESSGEAGSR
jgi:thiol:disulfide interchange protein